MQESTPMLILALGTFTERSGQWIVDSRIREVPGLNLSRKTSCPEAIDVGYVSTQPTLQPPYFQGKGPDTHWTEGFVGSRAGLDLVAKSKIKPQLILKFQLYF